MSSADLFIKINSLPAEMRKEVEAFLERLIKRSKSEGPDKRKGGVPGLAQGRIVISDDFDEPLEDFKPYME